MTEAVVPVPEANARESDSAIGSKQVNCSEGQSTETDGKSAASNGGIDVLRKVDVEEDLPPVRMTLFVMIAIVQGYTLIGPLQHSFKVAMGIQDKGAVAHVFTQAAALVQWGKFAMTLGQNVVFASVCPLVRVYIAMAGMMLGCFVPAFFVFALGSQWMGWVFISFGLLGMSLGIFECTFLNVITPLGPRTKCWAITGFPAAFAIINVVGFTLVSYGMPVQVLFWYIVACMPIGAFIFAKVVVPKVQDDVRAARGSDVGATRMKTAAIWTSMKDASSWLPMVLPFLLINIVGHFVMEGALPANFNTYNDKQVPLFGKSSEDHLMNTHRFFVIFFVFVGVGDIFSRRFAYFFSLDTYLVNLIALLAALTCCLLGMYLFTLGIGVVAWISAFLTFAGQGFNYAVSSKFFDRFVPREHNLAAYSFWMFAGSAGAIAGSTMVDVIRQWICHGEEFPHECLAHH